MASPKCRHPRSPGRLIISDMVSARGRSAQAILREVCGRCLTDRASAEALGPRPYGKHVLPVPRGLARWAGKAKPMLAGSEEMRLHLHTRCLQRGAHLDGVLDRNGRVILGMNQEARRGRGGDV